MKRHCCGRIFTRTGLALGLALTLPATAGPSQPHFGAHPQGQSDRETGHAGFELRLRDEGTARLEATAREDGGTGGAQCPEDGRSYRRSLAVTLFSREAKAGANAGGLRGAERGLAERFGETLAQSAPLYRYELAAHSLPGEQAEQVRSVQKIARQTDAQLVLAGSLHDLGMVRPRHSTDPGLVTRARNAAVGTLRLSPDWDTRQRQLVLRLRLFDGATGAELFQSDHQLQAVWNPKQPERARFGTPDFWSTDYGRELERLVETASDELSETIRCQPLVARLDSPRTGAPLLLHAGRVQGLKPGDRLPLHRLGHRRIPGHYRRYSAHLLDTGESIEVVETHPHYSEVRVEGGRRLRGEHLAVTPGHAPAMSGENHGGVLSRRDD